jgi:hypothetical protein
VPISGFRMCCRLSGRYPILGFCPVSRSSTKKLTSCQGAARIGDLPSSSRMTSAKPV